MIPEDQKKEIDELAEQMKSEVKEDHTILDVLQDWAEFSLTATWRQCENIIIAAYQIGKEHGRNEVRDAQPTVVNHDN
jgi:hypothetical protein